MKEITKNTYINKITNSLIDVSDIDREIEETLTKYKENELTNILIPELEFAWVYNKLQAQNGPTLDICLRDIRELVEKRFEESSVRFDVNEFYSTFVKEARANVTQNTYFYTVVKDVLFGELEESMEHIRNNTGVFEDIALAIVAIEMQRIKEYYEENIDMSVESELEDLLSDIDNVIKRYPSITPEEEYRAYVKDNIVPGFQYIVENSKGKYIWMDDGKTISLIKEYTISNGVLKVNKNSKTYTYNLNNVRSLGLNGTSITVNV